MLESNRVGFVEGGSYKNDEVLKRMEKNLRE
jgi:hypothetical protein